MKTALRFSDIIGSEWNQIDSNDEGREWQRLCLKALLLEDEARWWEAGANNVQGYNKYLAAVEAARRFSLAVFGGTCGPQWEHCCCGDQEATHRLLER